MKNKSNKYRITAYVFRALVIVAFIAYAWSLIMYEFNWINLMMLFMTASLLHLPISKIQRMLEKDVSQVAADAIDGEPEDIALDELILRSISTLLLLFIVAKWLYHFFV